MIELGTTSHQNVEIHIKIIKPIYIVYYRNNIFLYLGSKKYLNDNKW